MSEIVNLRQARKAKARRDAEATASANRALFGRGKAERATEEARVRRDQRHLDGHRLDLDGRTPDSRQEDL
jgi:hypothetical protein